MNIILKIIKTPEGSDLKDKIISVGPQGLSMGRSENNDLPLTADPAISKQHAVIQYQQGNFYIYDTSTNGVYVNNQRQPLNAGENNSALLRHDETFRIGEYVFLVGLEDKLMSDTASVDLDNLLMGSPSHQSNILAEERVEEDLSQDFASDPHRFDLDSFLQGAKPTEAVSPLPVNMPSDLMHSDWPSKNMSPSTASQPASLSTFFEALGLSDYKIEGNKQEEILKKLSFFITQAFQFLVEAAQKNQATTKPDGSKVVEFKKQGNNPFFFSVNAEEALKKCLFPPSGEVYLTLETALPDVFSLLEVSNQPVSESNETEMVHKDQQKQLLEKFAPEAVAPLLKDVEVKTDWLGRGKTLANFEKYHDYYIRVLDETLKD